MARYLTLFFVNSVLAWGSAQAIDNPLSFEAKTDYRIVRDLLIRAAEKMPAEDYDFKPTSEVRSFAQLIGHVVDEQYRYCSAAASEDKTSAFEQNPPPKPQMVAALRSAFTYCDVKYDTFTDAIAMDKVKFRGRQMPRLIVFTLHAGHCWEHYGNVVVYLRLKGIVPPSSEPQKK